jgi:NAD(P)-dependent dehydrogenase (short-subunit alcohol dehydrogenase family)
MNVVVLGGTRGIGRAVARRMVARGDRVFLLGRNADDLARSAADLQVRGTAGADVGSASCDLEDPASFAPALDRAGAHLGRIDVVVVTAALFATQQELEADATLLSRVLTVNFTNTIGFCEEARMRLMAAGGGTLCVFSSVAGDRGRKPTALYGAAKAGLSQYLEALDHRYHAQGLRAICVKPGFVRTAMTAGLPEPPFAADADDVARYVVRGIDRGTPVVYTPPIWWLIMLIMRSLPRSVMRRIEF